MSLTQLPLESLVRLCSEETAKFRRQENYDPRPCLEIFRRAIALQDQAAWGTVCRQYRSQVLVWVRRHWAYPVKSEPTEALVNDAFRRFWQAMTPQGFARYRSLGEIMGYLRRCVNSTMVDAHRNDLELPWLKLDVEKDPVDLIDRQKGPLERLRWKEFREWVLSQVHDEKERVVVIRSFQQGFPPREIYARHPDLFSDVREVHRVKRNILDRLRRHPGKKDFGDLLK